MTELERVSILRDWAYTMIPHADKNAYIDFTDPLVYSPDAGACLTNVLYLRMSNKGGFYCGGIASTLANLYRLLGYETCTLDLAVMDDLYQVAASHVVTLVNIGISASWWSVQDATFNLTYADASGNGIDLNTLRALLKERAHDQIVIRRGPSKWRPYITEEGVGSIRTDYFTNPDMPPLSLNGRYQYQQFTDINVYNSNFKAEIEPYLLRDGYPVDGKYIFLYPYAVYDAGAGRGLGQSLLEQMGSAADATSQGKKYKNHQLSGEFLT